MNAFMRKIYRDWFVTRKITVSYDGYYFVWGKDLFSSYSNGKLPKRLKVKYNMFTNKQIKVEDLFVEGNLFLLSASSGKKLPEIYKVIGKIFRKWRGLY